MILVELYLCGGGCHSLLCKYGVSMHGEETDLLISYGGCESLTASFVVFFKQRRCKLNCLCIFSSTTAASLDLFVLFDSSTLFHYYRKHGV